MCAKRNQPADQCAEQLVSILSERRRASKPGVKKHEVNQDRRHSALSALRKLDEAALLEALNRVYQAAQQDTSPEKSKGATHGRQSPAAAERASTVSLLLWTLTAALAGGVIMVLELTAFRLYAPYFGYSIYVWGSMISVVMIALAIGYALGGWIADRSHSDAPLYLTILIGAAYQLAVVYTVGWLLPALAGLGDAAGALVATLMIFVIPMSCLATAGPFVIRLLSRTGRTGITAGGIYALSTLGSVVGVVLTTFYFVPALGTHKTLCIACAATAVLGIVGMMRSRRRALFGVLPFLSLPLAPGVAWGENTVWVGESAYNLIRVVQDGEDLKLILNDESSVASRINQSSGYTGGYYDDFSLGPRLISGRRGLSLGMGAGASLHAAWAVAPKLEFDAVEIDPKVVEAAHLFFGLKRNDPRLHVHVADARPWLASTQEEYDLVHVDLYQGGPYIPFYLVTQEFFGLVARRMSSDALLMMNVLDMSPKRELVKATCATLQSVFPSVFALSRATGNHMVFAFNSHRALASVQETLRQLTGDNQFELHARQAAERIFSAAPSPDSPIFTDDHAPVAAMTRRMLAYGTH